MIMLMEQGFVIYSFFVGLVFLIIGIVLWAVGASKPSYYQSTVLTSIPIYPSSEDGFSEYIGVYPVDDQRVYSLSDLGDIYVELSYAEINNPKSAQTIYLIHNFYSYYINFSIVDGENQSYFDFFTSRNLDKSNITEVPQFISENHLIPDSFRYQNQYQLKCPIPTLITTRNHISRGCPELGGYQMKISDRVQILKTDDFIFHKPMPPIYVVFHKLVVFPMNYIDTPQMYFTSWKKTNKSKLVISGIVFTVTGIILVIFDTWVFFEVLFCLEDD